MRGAAATGWRGNDSVASVLGGPHFAQLIEPLLQVEIVRHLVR